MARGTAEETKRRIRAAATELFRRRGIAGVSVREIGAAAGSDPALVIRHFGSKEPLFLETMHVDPEHEQLLDGPVEDLGRRYVGVLLDFPDRTRETFLALLRGSSEPAIAEQLVRAHVDLFVAPMRTLLSGPDVDLRARLAASLVGGLLYSTWVVGDEELLAADQHLIVDRYGEWPRTRAHQVGLLVSDRVQPQCDRSSKIVASVIRTVYLQPDAVPRPRRSSADRRREDAAACSLADLNENAQLASAPTSDTPGSAGC